MQHAGDTGGDTGGADEGDMGKEAKDCSSCIAACAESEAQKGYEYSTSSATYAVKPGGN